MKAFIVALFAAVTVVSAQYDVPIVRQASAIQPDGSYQHSYETGNGIVAEEHGIGGQVAEGSAQWTAPDGTPVSIQYTADENGFHAQGSHVPQTPEYVLRALEYIRTHPYNEEQELAKQRQREAVRASSSSLQFTGAQTFVAPPQQELAAPHPEDFQDAQRRVFRHRQ